MVILPDELTAANGAKSLLSGEFKETIRVDNPYFCGCGTCDFCVNWPKETEYITQSVDVSWTTIKAIYKKIVANLAEAEK
jgi:hypothetical protein